MREKPKKMVARRFLGFKNKNTHHPKYKQGQKFLQGFVFYLRKWTTTAFDNQCDWPVPEKWIQKKQAPAE